MKSTSFHFITSELKTQIKQQEDYKSLSPVHILLRVGFLNVAHLKNVKRQLPEVALHTFSDGSSFTVIIYMNFAFYTMVNLSLEH